MKNYLCPESLPLNRGRGHSRPCVTGRTGQHRKIFRTRPRPARTMGHGGTCRGKHHAAVVSTTVRTWCSSCSPSNCNKYHFNRNYTVNKQNITQWTILPSPTNGKMQKRGFCCDRGRIRSVNSVKRRGNEPVALEQYDIFGVENGSQP